MEKSGGSVLYVRCSKCEQKPATIQCVECQTKRCYECDRFLHDQELQHHTRRVASLREVQVNDRPLSARSLYTPGDTMRSTHYNSWLHSSRLDPLRSYEEERHDRQVNSMRNEIEHLRRQLDLSQVGRNRELAKSREQINFETSLYLKDKQNLLESQKVQIEDLERSLRQQGDGNTMLRSEILQLKQSLQEQASDSEKQIKALHQELEYYRSQYNRINNNDIVQLKTELDTSQRQYQSQFSELKLQSDEHIQELSKRLESKDRQISDLEHELAQARTMNINQNKQYEYDIFNLKEAMSQSTQKHDGQQLDISRMQQSNSEMKSQVNMLNKENRVLQDENLRMSRERSDLKDAVYRLERIVYGPRNQHY